MSRREQGRDVPPETTKRSFRSKLIEFLWWTAVAIATAVILVSLSERLLPTNF